MVAAAALVAVYLVRQADSISAIRLLLAFAVAGGFALLAWIARGVNWNGAVGGCCIAFIFALKDLRLFWELLVVFGLTYTATRAGRGRKEQLHVSEAPAGRSASQVISNLGVAGLVTAMIPSAWPCLALAALAEAAADTSSSEIGMAFPGKTVLLTSWKPVAAGVDGGISLSGTLAAVVAAAVVASAALLLKLVSLQHALAVTSAGVLGSLVDSLLGAVFERRGMLSNDLVNLLSTAAAALAMTAFVI